MATKDTNPSSSRSGDAITPGEWVRYDQLERKETRVRPDQYNSLSELSRGLNRQRHGRGVRHFPLLSLALPDILRVQSGCVLLMR